MFAVLALLVVLSRVAVLDVFDVLAVFGMFLKDEFHKGVVVQFILLLSIVFVVLGKNKEYSAVICSGVFSPFIKEFVNSLTTALVAIFTAVVISFERRVVVLLFCVVAVCVVAFCVVAFCVVVFDVIVLFLDKFILHTGHLLS